MNEITMDHFISANPEGGKRQHFTPCVVLIPNNLMFEWARYAYKRNLPVMNGPITQWAVEDFVNRHRGLSEPTEPQILDGDGSRKSDRPAEVSD